MIKQLKRTILILLSLLILSSSTEYAAEPSHYPVHPRFSEKNWARFEHKLNLTQDQISALNQINQRYQTQIESIQTKMRPIQDALRGELSKDPINTTQIQIDLEHLAPYQIQLKLLGIKHFEEVQHILTPDQRQKMKVHREKMMEKPFFKRIQGLK